MIKIWCLWNKKNYKIKLHSIRQNNYVNIDKCIFPYKNSLLMNVMMWNQIYSKYVLQVHHICFYVLGWDKIWMKVCAISKMFCLEIFVVSLVWNLPLLEAERKPYELIYVIHVFVKIMFIKLSTPNYMLLICNYYTVLIVFYLNIDWKFRVFFSMK